MLDSTALTRVQTNLMARLTTSLIFSTKKAITNFQLTSKGMSFLKIIMSHNCNQFIAQGRARKDAALVQTFFKMDYKERILARIDTAKKDLEEAKERLENAPNNFEGKELKAEKHVCESVIEATTYLIEELEYMLEQGEE